MTAPVRSLLAVACFLSLLGACSRTQGVKPDGASDGSGGDLGPSSRITYWLAPNGSEVVLKLDTVEPTVPF